MEWMLIKMLTQGMGAMNAFSQSMLYAGLCPPVFELDNDCRWFANSSDDLLYPLKYFNWSAARYQYIGLRLKTVR